MCFSKVKDISNNNCDEILFENETGELENGLESQDGVTQEFESTEILSSEENVFNINTRFFDRINQNLSEQSVNILKKLFDYIRKIIALFNSSSLLMDQLLSKQDNSPLRPIQDVKTRWNSTF